MREGYEAFFRNFRSNEPSTEVSLCRVESDLGLIFPIDYREFLLQFGGGEGFVGNQYLIFWAADEIGPFNADYEVREYAPGLLLIGSNGGGEGFAFDLRSGRYNIVVVPFIGMSLECATSVAPTFVELLEKLNQPDAGLF